MLLLSPLLHPEAEDSQERSGAEQSRVEHVDACQVIALVGLNVPQQLSPPTLSSTCLRSRSLLHIPNTVAAAVC